MPNSLILERIVEVGWSYPGRTLYSFANTTVPNQKLWFKADALSLNDGDAVATWTDSSPAPINGTQATGSKKPTYKTNIINGKPVVRWDGGDYLQLGTEFTVTDFHLFLVASLSGSGDRIVLGGHSNTNYIADFDSISSKCFINNGSDASTTAVFTGSTVFLLEIKCVGGVVTFRRNDAVDVTLDGTMNGSTITVGAIGGRNGGSAGEYFNGDIAELVLYSAALSDADATKVRKYLNAKYNVYTWATRAERIAKAIWDYSGTTRTLQAIQARSWRGRRAAVSETGSRQYRSAGAFRSETIVVSSSTYTGTVALTAGHVTVSASATFAKPTYTAAATVTVGNATAALVGTFALNTYTASAALTTGHPTVSGSATFAKPVYTAAAAVSTGSATAALAGTFTKPTYTATAAVSVGHIVGAGSATFTKPSYTATAAVTVGHPTVAGSAVFANAVYVGSVAVSVGHPTAALVGTFTKPTYAASAALVVGNTTATGVGTFTGPTYSATVAVTTGHPTASGSATFTPVFRVLGAVTVGNATAALVGTFTKPTYTGVLAVTVGQVTVVGFADDGIDVFVVNAFHGQVFIPHATAGQILRPGVAGYGMVE